jgi:hypothetical protein
MDMIQLRDKQSGALLGFITEEDLQFLIDNLEEEWLEDTDYYLNRTTLEMLKSLGGNPSIITLLEDAMRDRDDVEIQWKRV